MTKTWWMWPSALGPEAMAADGASVAPASAKMAALPRKGHLMSRSSLFRPSATHVATYSLGPENTAPKNLRAIRLDDLIVRPGVLSGDGSGQDQTGAATSEWPQLL